MLPQLQSDRSQEIVLLSEDGAFRCCNCSLTVSQEIVILSEGGEFLPPQPKDPDAYPKPVPPNPFPDAPPPQQVTTSSGPPLTSPVLPNPPAPRGAAANSVTSSNSASIRWTILS